MGPSLHRKIRSGGLLVAVPVFGALEQALSLGTAAYQGSLVSQFGLLWWSGESDPKTSRPQPTEKVVMVQDDRVGMDDSCARMDF